MLVKPCAKCKRLIQYNGRSYCPSCEVTARAERDAQALKRKRIRDRAYNRKREPRYSRFYSSADWRRTSKAKMAEANYRCEECGAIAAEVHHIDPIQTDAGWHRRLEWSNLKALCIRCHNKAHRRFGGSGRSWRKP